MVVEVVVVVVVVEVVVVVLAVVVVVVLAVVVVLTLPCQEIEPRSSDLNSDSLTTELRAPTRLFRGKKPR